MGTITKRLNSSKRKKHMLQCAAVFFMVILCVCVTVLITPSQTWAEDKLVNDWSSLQSAVKNASAGDTIRLGADIDATSSASLCVKKNITVDGDGHTIDGQDKYGMFVTKGGTLTLKNATIANAYRSSEKKGCVLYAYSGGGASFENCVIYNCRDTYSSSTGVINCGSYKLEMNHCTIIDSSRGVTVGSSGSVKNSILAGSGTDLIFKSSSSSFADAGYNLIAKTSSQPASFGAETSTIDEGLANHSSWLTPEGDLIASENNPAINKIPVGEGFEDIGGRQHEPTENVSEINIVTPPSKTDYLEGQKFSRSGMTVQAVYEDGTTKNITSYTCDPSGPLTLDDDKITVSFGGKTAEIAITVSEADVIDSAEKLKDAITENNNTGDAVLKLEKDITLDSNWNSAVSISKDLTIDGNGHTINGAGQYALALSPSSSANLTVRDLVARNMNSSGNAAFIYASSSSYKGSITLQNAVMRGNTGNYGTIYVSSASSAFLNMDHCTVIDNHSTRSSSSGYTALYLKNGTANINDCIFVNNTYTNNGTVQRDITISSGTLNAKNNVIGVISGKTPDSTNKVSSEYKDYSNWMDNNGELFYPTMDGKENPAVDIHKAEIPSDALQTDLAGAVRPQGKGGDAGAYESEVFNAAKPTLTQNLSPDPDNYLVGDDAEPLSIKAKIKDDGKLIYEWYYIDYIDEVTTATKKVENANTDTLTPPTDSVGRRSYFAVAYNRNENNSWINGKNGVFDEDADADTRRANSVYAISEHHPVNVSVDGLELTGIKVTKAPDKTEYIAGQKFDSEGIEVSGIYSDTSPEENNTKTIPISAGYTFEPAGALTTSDKAVTVSYEGFTTEQPITVIAKVATSIEITSAPAKLTYDEGDAFDKAGMVVKAHFNDGSSRNLADDEYDVEPAADLTKDITSVQIKYTNEDGSVCTADQPVTVGINNIDQLRSAISGAKAGDTLTLTADITMDDNGAISVNKDLTIKGNGHRIFGAGSGFISHTGGNLELRALEVMGMSSDDAAVLYSSGNCGNVTIRNCIIRDNAAVKGAVYFNPDADKTLSIIYSTIIDNKSATKETGRSAKSGAGSAPSGYAGGINVSDNGQLELKADIIVGNVLSTRYEDFDVRANQITSKGFNIIGVSYDFDAKETDRVNAQYADHESWLNADGTPVNSETDILLAESCRPDAEEGDKDLTGKERSEKTNAGALEVSESYDHGDKPDEHAQEDQEAAASTAALIDDLPDADNITLDNEAAVIDAKNAFDNLTEAQKALVEAKKLEKLEEAVAKIEELKRQAAIDNVTLMIVDLPDAEKITLVDKTIINNAKAAFDNLTAEQKAAVPEVLKAKLTAAEAVIDKLIAEGDKAKADAKAGLAAAVVDALSLNAKTSVYTNASCKSFLNAVKSAQAVLKKAGATADQYAAAEKALKKAQKALKKKKANTLKVKTKTVTIKVKTLKKKAQAVNVKKAFAVSKAKGAVTYTKAGGNKKITIAKAGKITVGKGLKAGTYKLKVKVKAAGNGSFKPLTKTVTVKIVIKK